MFQRLWHTVARGFRAMEQQQDHDGGLARGADPALAQSEEERAMLEEARANQDAHIERNTVQAGATLPWTEGGWDANQILTNMVQYDRLPDTNSDSTRCVQAAALAAYILQGPGATEQFLRQVVENQPRPMNSRQAANAGMLQSVAGMIASGNATYDDLSLAQEALHDLAIADDAAGTSAEDIQGQMVTEGGPASLEPMDTWLSSPADLMRHAADLAPGQHLIATVWSVSFNEGFLQAEDQGFDEDELDVEIVDDEGNVTGTAHIRRIDDSQRPDPADFDWNRDSRSGHQILVYKDQGGALRVYEPEQTPTGDHQEPIAGPTQRVAGYFDETPDMGIYKYIQLMGRITPTR